MFAKHSVYEPRHYHIWLVDFDANLLEESKWYTNKADAESSVAKMADGMTFVGYHKTGNAKHGYTLTRRTEVLYLYIIED